MAVTRRIPLTDAGLQAELRSTAIEGGSIPALWFTCPVCGEHSHAVHYRREGQGTIKRTRVWQWVSGTSLDDLTLAPSYLARSPHRRLADGRRAECRLHCYVQDGTLEILGDSKLTILAED